MTMLWKNPPRHQQSEYASRMRLALRNTHGETITEVLVAMVIVGLALLMLAVVIAASSNIVRKDRDYMEDYYDTGNMLATYSGESKYSAHLIATDKTSGADVKLSLEDGNSISIEIYANDDDSVVSYVKAEES